MLHHRYNPVNMEHETFGCSHIGRNSYVKKLELLISESPLWGWLANGWPLRQGVSWRTSIYHNDKLRVVSKLLLGTKGRPTDDGNQKSGVHQLRLVAYLNIYKVLYIPGGAGFSSINSIFNKFYTEQVAQYLPIHGFMTALVQHSVSARKIWQPGCLSFSTRPLCLSFASLSQFTYDPQIYVKDKRPHKQKWCCRNCYDTMTSGQTIGFHQPGFALNKGFFLDTFWGEAVWGRYNLTRWHGIT